MMRRFWREAEIKWNYIARFTPFKWHYACFDCRVGIKTSGPASRDYIGIRCGRCGKDAVHVGKDCRIPKKKDIKGWKTLKGLIDSGITFNPRDDKYSNVTRVRYPRTYEKPTE